MSGRARVVPLDRVPTVRQVAPPALDADALRRLDSERSRIEADAHLVDGPILMTRSASAAEVAVYPATYAWHTADRAVPLVGTIGGLGVQLVVETAPGALLWQRRSDAVDHPGGWTISVAGCAFPGPGLEEQIRAEAAEELGLGARALTGLRPLALVVSEPRRVVEVVFHARLRRGVRPRPDPAEVAEIRIAPTPEGLGSLDTLTGDWWPDLVRLAAACR